MTSDGPTQEPNFSRRGPSFEYDVFLSHNRADKDWVRKIATRLGDHKYNGRPLRPWLDEQVLDPGVLGRRAELTTALDRSRLFVIVLSPEAVQSTWVQEELQYFLATRTRDQIIPIRRRPCEIPDVLGHLDVLDWTDGFEFESRFSRLTSLICSGHKAEPADIIREVKDAMWASFMSGSSRFDPTPTVENSALLAELLKYDITDAADEGLALTAFDEAGDGTLGINPDDSYGTKMLLGEILAAAVLKNERYRQVVPRYLAREPDATLHPNLSFAVLRSASKLAEVDGRLVDICAVWAALAKLDRVGGLLSPERKAAVVLGARIVAKMRGSELGDLLIRMLSIAGSASRIAAIGAITMGEDRSRPVFYLSELEEIARSKSAPAAPAFPPSHRLVALLDEIARDASAAVQQAHQLGIADLQQDFGDRRSTDTYTWKLLREEPPAPLIMNGPIIGTLRRITTANMENAALALRVSDIACLTEPRIVDALLGRCGAFLIGPQDIASPLCRRLIGRDRRFAMVEKGLMDTLADGDCVAIQPRGTTVVPGRG